jgi:hypothetical protein
MNGYNLFVKQTIETQHIKLQQVVKLWRLLSVEEKNVWNTRAREQRKTNPKNDDEQSKTTPTDTTIPCLSYYKRLQIEQWIQNHLDLEVVDPFSESEPEPVVPDQMLSTTVPCDSTCSNSVESQSLTS